MAVNIKLSNVTIKRIDFGFGFYVLAIPDTDIQEDPHFYKFLLCHDRKAAVVLSLFDNTLVRCIDDEQLQSVAMQAYECRLPEYLTMLETVDQFN